MDKSLSAARRAGGCGPSFVSGRAVSFGSGNQPTLRSPPGQRSASLSFHGNAINDGSPGFHGNGRGGSGATHGGAAQIRTSGTLDFPASEPGFFTPNPAGYGPAAKCPDEAVLGTAGFGAGVASGWWLSRRLPGSGSFDAESQNGFSRAVSESIAQVAGTSAAIVKGIVGLVQPGRSSMAGAALGMVPLRGPRHAPFLDMVPRVVSQHALSQAQAHTPAHPQQADTQPEDERANMHAHVRAVPARMQRVQAAVSSLPPVCEAKETGTSASASVSKLATDTEVLGSKPLIGARVKSSSDLPGLSDGTRAVARQRALTAGAPAVSSGAGLLTTLREDLSTSTRQGRIFSTPVPNVAVPTLVPLSPALSRARALVGLNATEVSASTAKELLATLGPESVHRGAPSSQVELLATDLPPLIPASPLAMRTSRLSAPPPNDIASMGVGQVATPLARRDVSGLLSSPAVARRPEAMQAQLPSASVLLSSPAIGRRHVIPGHSEVKPVSSTSKPANSGALAATAPPNGLDRQFSQIWENSLTSQIWKESSSASSVEALARSLQSAGAETHAARILEEHNKSSQRRKDSISRLLREQEKSSEFGSTDAIPGFSTVMADFVSALDSSKSSSPERNRTRSEGSMAQARALYNLGVSYKTGRGVPRDLVKAAEYYASAAALGHAKAMYNLGVLHVNGEGGVTKDWAKAAGLFERAAQQGFAHAQRSVGLCYAYGKGIPRDQARAQFWLEKAAAQGDLDARCELERLGRTADMGAGTGTSLPGSAHTVTRASADASTAPLTSDAPSASSPVQALRPPGDAKGADTAAKEE